MKTITEYTTARGDSIKDLDAAVNALIQNGYQPFGSPYVTESNNEFLACQAMVKVAESATV